MGQIANNATPASNSTIVLGSGIACTLPAIGAAYNPPPKSADARDQGLSCLPEIAGMAAPEVGVSEGERRSYLRDSPEFRLVLGSGKGWIDSEV